jgi:hypothetical protein
MTYAHITIWWASMWISGTAHSRIAEHYRFRLCSGWTCEIRRLMKKPGSIPLQAGPAFMSFTPAGSGQLESITR